MVQIRVDPETETRATAVLESVGLSVSDAVALFLRRVAADRGLPFPLKEPNAETRAAMEEADAIVRDRHKRLTADALFADLEDTGDR